VHGAPKCTETPCLVNHKFKSFWIKDTIPAHDSCVYFSSLLLAKSKFIHIHRCVDKLQNSVFLKFGGIWHIKAF
jgi:hypothetical protein